jgi:Tol biopolymer transport system component
MISNSTQSRFSGFAFILFLILIGTGCGQQSGSSMMASSETEYNRAGDVLRYDGEEHIRNIKQLTFGGNNAEAYWSSNDEALVFQSDWDKINDQGCDQIFVMNPSAGTITGQGDDYTLISTGMGRTTCSFFMPGDQEIVFASTHEAATECPAPVMFSADRYVWPVYDGYDIYVAGVDGSDIKPLISGPGYDAEATVSPDGKYIIFTSTRTGDLELWRYEIATGALLQLTDGLGYDGGAFFSHDSQKIVWRASRPEGEAADVYKALLADGLVEPAELNIFVADIDGSNVVQVTDLPGANWAPYFHPDDDRILFTSNHHSIDRGGREFDLFLIGVDGSDMKRITHSGTFDGFPMFSYDGSKLVFASNRNEERLESRDTNVFVADWVEMP